MDMMKLVSHLTQKLKTLSQRLFGEEGHNNVQKRLAKGAAGTFGQKLVNMVLLLLINLLLARILGVTEYGLFSYVQAWIFLLVVPAVFGMDQLLVRNIAAYHTQSAWGLMGGLLRRANQIVLLSSLSLVLLAIGCAWGVATFWGTESDQLMTFWIALVVLPFTVLVKLRQAAMRGLHHVVTGQLPERIIQPILFLLLIIGMYQFWVQDLSAPVVMGLKVVSILLAFFIGAWMLMKALPTNLHETSPIFQTSAWLKSALPLFLATGLYTMNAQVGILMLGAMKGPREVGIYVVANRLAGLIAFFLAALNMALGPTISKLYTEGEMTQLQQVITKGARVTFFLAIPISLAMMVFGYWFLLPFGEAFTEGRWALALLTVGQLVNVAMGSVVLLLIMTGHERDAAIGVSTSVVLSIIFNGILIPLWGLNGAAAASSFALILWNILLAIWVQKKLGIHSTALGHLWPRQRQKAPGLSSP